MTPELSRLLDEIERILGADVHERLLEGIALVRERAYREGLKDGYRDARPRSDAA